MGTSETLRSVIDAGKTSKRLDELSAARVIGKAAQQVHAAQQKAGAGKAVGPVTPATIALASSGEVSLALPGTSTLSYSAPEVIGGAAGDKRSDVFSLGVVMWEALTHQRLFEAMNDAAVKAAVNEREISPPSELNANIPAELSAICMRALARNPADRYQSAKSMGVEIEEFLEEAGYADNDDQIAAFLADLGKSKAEKKVALPPPTKPVESKTPTPPPGALPSVLTAPTQPPSILKSPTTTPPPTGSPGAALASALASAGAIATSPSDKSTTAPGMGPSTLVPPAPAANARTANGTAPPPAVPMAPVLPTNGDAKVNPSQTVLGIGSVPHTPAEPAKPEAPKTLVDAPKPEAPTNVTMPATPAAIASATPTVSAPPVVPTVPAPPVLPASVRAASQPSAKTPEEAAPAAAMGASESRPNPAAVVALPHRDSKGGGDVLAGWGWGTDSHQAITDDSDLDLPAHGSNKKLLLYLLGGGLVFTIMVAVIAFGFGGSKKKKAPPPAAATQEWNGSSQPGSDTTATGSAMAGSADTGSAMVAGSTDTGSAMTGSATVAGSADTGSAMAATTGTTGSAAVATTAPTKGSAAVATTGPVNPYPDTPDTTTPPKTTKTETPKTTKTEPPKVTKTETPKTTKTTKTETPKTTRTTRVETPKTTKTETPKTTKSDAPKVDAEQAYRVGLQQFARGDTTGALASLRTSLAANPNYAPTWRGLGLVFEKLGEKDQARAAYKRYLQLAPSAGDAENIRSRLERLAQ